LARYCRVRRRRVARRCCRGPLAHEFGCRARYRPNHHCWPARLGRRLCSEQFAGLAAIITAAAGLLATAARTGTAAGAAARTVGVVAGFGVRVGEHMGDDLVFGHGLEGAVGHAQE
jgi:hypothetical protein